MYSLALLLLAADPTVDDARKSYALLMHEAERQHLEAAVRSARAGRTPNASVRAAEENLRLWKQGLHTPPDVSIPSLARPKHLRVGDVGTLMPFIVRSWNEKEGEGVISVLLLDHFNSPYEPEPVILKHLGMPLSPDAGQYRFSHKYAFWVSGMRGEGKSAVPVVERLIIP